MLRLRIFSGITKVNYLRSRQTDFLSGFTSFQSTKNGGVFHFLHILDSMCSHLRFDFSHSNWRKVESLGHFDFDFTDH